MAAPEGDHTGVPIFDLPTFFGFSLIVYVFQSCLPVRASSASMLPRNVQQGYFGSAIASSSDDTGTYSAPS